MWGMLLKKKTHEEGRNSADVWGGGLHAGDNSKFFIQQMNLNLEKIISQKKCEKSINYTHVT